MAYDTDNIFAKIIRGEAPAVRVYEDEQTLAFMDIMPQSLGHTLVLAKAPAENLFDLSRESLLAVMTTTQKVARAVRDACKADGVTLMQFNGTTAGQTVFHFHVHIVPRYAGEALASHARHKVTMAALEQQAAGIRQRLAVLS